MLGGVIVVIARRRFFARARRVAGKIRSIDADSSGEWRLVGYVPEGETEEVTFVDLHDDHEVGAAVDVLYDTRRAAIDGPAQARVHRTAVRVLVGVGLLVVAMGFVFHLALRPTLAEIGRRDAALLHFLSAVRAHDTATIARLTARDARIDRAFLDDLVRSDDGFHEGASAGGLRDGCVVGSIGGTQIVAYLVVEDGIWKVQRAANRDPVCEDRVD